MEWTQPRACRKMAGVRSLNPLFRMPPSAAGLIILALLLLQINLDAQTITIDTSPSGQRQVIDGFGTCVSGSEATQTWWQNIYFGDLRASMLRMDLSPAFKAPYSSNNYNSPSYGVPGPNDNYVRAYTNATTQTANDQTAAAAAQAKADAAAAVVAGDTTAQATAAQAQNDALTALVAAAQAAMLPVAQVPAVQ